MERPKQGTEKTPTAWAKTCLEIMKQVHPAYKQKRPGKRVEYLRTDESGLLISHSFLYHHHSYRHSFAVLFSDYMSDRLISPLRTRGRFDDNHDIFAAYADDMGIDDSHPLWPRGLVTWYCWGPEQKKIPGSPANLDDPFPMVVKVTSHAEQHLLPFYRKILARGSKRLVGVFSMALRMLTELDFSGDLSNEPLPALAERVRSFGFDHEDLVSHHGSCINISAVDIALDRGDLAKIPERIKDVCLALWNIREFFPVKNELPGIIETAKGLERHET